MSLNFFFLFFERQKMCPANKKVKDWVKLVPIFNEIEIQLFLNGIKFDDLPKHTKNTIREYDLADKFKLISRNLSPFFKRDFKLI